MKEIKGRMVQRKLQGFGHVRRETERGSAKDGGEIWKYLKGDQLNNQSQHGEEQHNRTWKFEEWRRDEQRTEHDGGGSSQV